MWDIRYYDKFFGLNLLEYWEADIPYIWRPTAESRVKEMNFNGHPKNKSGSFTNYKYSKGKSLIEFKKKKFMLWCFLRNIGIIITKNIWNCIQITILYSSWW